MNRMFTSESIDWLAEHDHGQPEAELLKSFFERFADRLDEIELGDWKEVLATCRDISKTVEIEQKRGEIVDLLASDPQTGPFGK